MKTILSIFLFLVVFFLFYIDFIGDMYYLAKFGNEYTQSAAIGYTLYVIGFVFLIVMVEKYIKRKDQK